jgi:hypothetical protein
MKLFKVRRSQWEKDHDERVIATAALCGCKFEDHWQGRWSHAETGRIYATQYEAADNFLSQRGITVE